MNIRFFDKINVIISCLSCLLKLPTFFLKIKIILMPLDAVRYWEFPYFLKFLKNIKVKNNKILDVSSPYMMSYILSKKNMVFYSNIDELERKNIKEHKSLIFMKEDATALSFLDNSFDIVYSISVIEHIYKNYIKAIKEMIRVLNPGGYLYLSFTVSPIFKEEWIKNDIYSDQYKNNNLTFFSYRFDEVKLREILDSMNNMEIVESDIFWERKCGLYNLMIDKMRQCLNKTNNFYFILKIFFLMLLNIFFGLFLMKGPSKVFETDKKFGNYQIILRKKCK